MDALHRLTISEATQVGDARRQAAYAISKHSFNEVQAGKIAIVISEAANNLAKFAKNGELVFGVNYINGAFAFEMWALDLGPGVANVSRCMEDGFSTSGTAGTGLGAIQRQSDVFDIFSSPGLGTSIYSLIYSQIDIVYNQQRSNLKNEMTWGGLCVPHPRETVSGDNWTIKTEGRRAVILMADGLGHGPVAATAASAAVGILENQSFRPCEEILDAVHRGLRSTRGAAVAIVELQLSDSKIRFASIGNISAYIFSWKETCRRRLASSNGTVGLQIPRVRAYEYIWPDDGVLVLFSDGLQSRCGDLENYPGLSVRHPSLIAGFLYKNFTRGNDDSTFFVLKKS